MNLVAARSPQDAYVCAYSACDITEAVLNITEALLNAQAVP